MGVEGCRVYSQRVFYNTIYRRDLLYKKRLWLNEATQIREQQKHLLDEAFL